MAIYSKRIVSLECKLAQNYVILLGLQILAAFLTPPEFELCK